MPTVQTSRVGTRGWDTSVELSLLLKNFMPASVIKGLFIDKSVSQRPPTKTHAQMYHAFSHKELQAWQRCKEVGEDFTRLSQADQLVLAKMIERQLTQGSPHFREQSEAWLAEALGEGAAALMVDRPRG